MSHPASVPPEELVATVGKAGYTAALPELFEERREDSEVTELTDGVRQLVVTALLAVPVLVLSMVPSLQFRNWQWLCFVLAAPVAVWGAWPFHVRAGADWQSGDLVAFTLHFRHSDPVHVPAVVVRPGS